MTETYKCPRCTSEFPIREKSKHGNDKAETTRCAMKNCYVVYWHAGVMGHNKVRVGIDPAWMEGK